MAKKTVIKIDKNVPIPDLSGHGNSKYPWAKMEVGDSFVTTQRTAYSSARNQSRHGKKFIVRKQSDGLYRVWRVE